MQKSCVRQRGFFVANLPVPLFSCANGSRLTTAAVTEPRAPLFGVTRVARDRSREGRIFYRTPFQRSERSMTYRFNHSAASSAAPVTTKKPPEEVALE